MRVAFVGFGEIAAAFAKAFVAAGARVSAYDVLLETPDGPARLAARAGGTPVAFAALGEAPREIGIDPVMTSATEALFRRSVALGLGAAFAARPPSMDPVIRFFDERLGKEPERK